MRVAFIGAGLMGAGMIRNLAAAGHEVVVHARTPEKAAGLPATPAATVAGAADGADVACVCVTDSADVEQVVEAVLTAAAPPPLVVDHSTIAPATARGLASRCAARGVGFLDCPVSGGPVGAEDGSLAVMVGGDPGDLERALPVLDAIGDPARRVHCGPAGAGLVAKLVNNLLVGVITAATAEALGMGQSAGVDPGLLRRVLLVSSGSSWQLEHLFPRVLAGDHRPGFRARDLRKDLGHAQDLAGGPLPLGDVAAGLFRAVAGEDDYGAVARLFMELPGR